MKYALVNNKRQEAQPGLTGNCELHGCPVIAKCGKVKIWHWAHIGQRQCDPWKESETEWHRAWKNCFPVGWQEVTLLAANGDKHRADVKTDQDYVIEFQYSPIKLEECQARENFYKKLVWVVNGTRRLRDKEKFLEYSNPVNSKAAVRTILGDFVKCALLRDWSSSNTTIFFDFSENTLWVLLPKTFKGKVFKRRYLFIIRRDVLIAILHAKSQVNCLETFLKSCAEVIINGEKSLR